MPEIQIPTIDWAVVAQLATIFSLATVLLLVDLLVPAGQKRVTGYLALVALLLTAAAGLPAWGLTITTFGGMLKSDSYALLFNWLFLAVGAITILLSLDYLPRHGIERGEYYVLILIAVGGMMLLSQGADLIVIFLGLELLSITLYVLTGFAYPRLSSEEAAMKYLLIGAFAAGFLVFGIALVYGATATVNLAGIAEFLSRQTLVAEDYTLLLAGSGLIIVGLGYKIAMAPFHMWTPDVYEGSPTPVTAFMSVGTKAAGFAALTRFLLEALPRQSDAWVPVLAALAGVTMLVGNLAAIAQNNTKRMLAYSSIGHAGYVLLGVLAGGSASARDLGVQGVIFYLIAYAFTNLAAFAVVIALEGRGEAAWSIDDFSGLWQRQPYLALIMALCMLSLAGIPPTAGFVAKFFVFSAAWQGGLQWLAVVGVITSAIAAFFYLRIVVLMFMRAPQRSLQPAVGRSLSIGTALAALGVVLFGILPAPVLSLLQQALLATR